METESEALGWSKENSTFGPSSYVALQYLEGHPGPPHRADEGSLAGREDSVFFGLALGSLDLPEAEHHQSHIDGIGAYAHDAEIIEHKEQDPGQVERTSERHQGTQHQQDGRPATPEAPCKTKQDQAWHSGAVTFQSTVLT